MFIETKPGVFQSPLLDSQQGVIHAYTSRFLGDMRYVPPRHKLKMLLNATKLRLVGAEQVHGVDIGIVTRDYFGKTIPKVDGLVYQQADQTERPLLGVITADCVPLLFVDAHAGVIGAAHAGWKGTLYGIAKNMVEKMVSLGAKPADTFVAMGAHIRSCCYNVEPDRAKSFHDSFNDEGVAFLRNSYWYVDLERANKLTLLTSGIVPEHIDSGGLCTSDNSHIFYSYRNSSTQQYGEQIAVIGLM